MREYNSETDYPLVLEAARATNEVLITPIARALTAAGIRWPNMNAPEDRAGAAVDRDILRAWKELGLHPKQDRQVGPSG